MHPRYRWFLDNSISERQDPRRIDFVTPKQRQRLRADHPDRPPLLCNAEPLLVNRNNAQHLRPEARTPVANMFLAGDYVRTETDLATMEGANEAARHAVNGLLAVEGRRERLKTHPLREPFGFLRKWDTSRADRGEPWCFGVLNPAIALGVRAAWLGSKALRTALDLGEAVLAKARRGPAPGPVSPLRSVDPDSPVLAAGPVMATTAKMGG